MRYPVCALPTVRLRCTPPVCDKRCSRRRRRAFLAHRSLHTLRLPLTPPLAAGKLVAAATRSGRFICRRQRSPRSPTSAQSVLLSSCAKRKIPILRSGFFVTAFLATTEKYDSRSSCRYPLSLRGGQSPLTFRTKLSVFVTHLDCARYRYPSVIARRAAPWQSVTPCHCEHREEFVPLYTPKNNACTTPLGKLCRHLLFYVAIVS